MIDRQVFAHWMEAFADRLKKPLAKKALTAYYAELSRRLDTTERFEAAAIRVFGTHVFNTWPAVEEFVAADKEVRRDADAAMRLTLDRIDESRRIAPRAGDPVHTQAVEQFAKSWRELLAEAERTSPPARTLPPLHAEPGVPEIRRREPIDFRRRAAGDR